MDDFQLRAPSYTCRYIFGQVKSRRQAHVRKPQTLGDLRCCRPGRVPTTIQLVTKIARGDAVYLLPSYANSG
jgi:hypothetical protein